jgi:putative tryptophan/tyrosine transport system substrate-binding protein
MKRRQFIAGLGSAAAWPLAAWAQRPALPVVGFLHDGTPDDYAGAIEGFRQGLNESGFFEGRNLAIEFRWARFESARLPELAADLVRRRVTVIATPGSPVAALAAKAVTTTIPIVFSTSGDPVQLGLVASLNRPGGNVTGLYDMNADLIGKELGLLNEIKPGAAAFAALVNPSTLYKESAVAQLQAAASTLGREIEILYVASNRDIDGAFARLVQKPLLVVPNQLFFTRRVQIVTLAARHAVPVLYPNREYPEVGGLMSYGSNVIQRNRQIGLYVGRILKGEKPADLPVLQPTKFEFVINLNTANALGLTIPETLLATADEVIQ